MAPDHAISILCVTSYEKGQDFLRACKPWAALFIF